MKNIIYLLASLGIVTVLIAGFLNLYYYTEEFDMNAFVSQKKVIQILENKRFKKLHTLFVKIQNDFEQGNIEDIHLQYAYRAFRNSNPKIEPLFQQWLVLMPNSWIARMAYASYENNRAWSYRGAQYSSDTNEQQFSNMEKHFTIAKKLLMEILTLKPELLPAYENLIEISKARGDIVTSKKVFLKALEYHPSSYSIRKIYLDSLAERWGRDFNEVKNVLSDAKQYYKSNPHLKSLSGYEEYLIADAMRIKNCSNTNVMYTIAIVKAIHPAYYSGRALLHKCNKEYDKALEDINTAISMRPDTSGLFYQRGKIYYKMKQYQLAIDDFTRSLVTNSHSPTFLRARARAYNKIKYYDSAILDLEKAMYYGKYDRYNYRLLGYVLHNNKEYANAAKAFNKSITLGENKSSTWYTLAVSQWHINNCEYLNSLRSYEKICKENKDCKQERLKWRVDTIRAVKQKKQCAGYY